MNYYYIIPSELVEQKQLTKAVLFGVIYSYCSGKTKTCTASNTTLAKKMGRSDRKSISKYLLQLEKEGWISIVNPKSKHRKIRTIKKICIAEHIRKSPPFNGQIYNKGDVIEYIRNSLTS